MKWIDLMKKGLMIVFIQWMVGFGMAQVVTSFHLGDAPEPLPGLIGNGITDIKSSSSALWFGTGHGLSRYDGTTQALTSYDARHGLGHGSISALYVHGDTIIVATATDTVTKIQAEPFPKGTGISLSFDGGRNWRHYPQPGPTPIQNVTYDIEVSNGVIWITSWGGGVRKSTDWGKTWLEAPPDSFNLDPLGKLNHRGFSAIVADGNLYIGTANGINKSSDGGKTWKNFNHTNQAQPISGNFVVALAHQKWADKSIIWAATWKAEDESEYYAVSYSLDGGMSWTTTLHDERPHNFAFQDSIVYVATDNGLYKSIDFGKSWYLFPPASNTITGERVYSLETYAAGWFQGYLWVGTADGLARTKDNGYSWDIFRAFQPTGQMGNPRTYAYPNPFSPMRHNQLGGDGHVRLQYNTLQSTYVTIKVYDFSLNLVATVVKNKYRAGAGDYAEVWNGRNDYGDMVANGVYFYSVTLDGDGTYWGKVMVVN